MEHGFGTLSDVFIPPALRDGVTTKHSFVDYGFLCPSRVSRVESLYLFSPGSRFDLTRLGSFMCFTKLLSSEDETN